MVECTSLHSSYVSRDTTRFVIGKTTNLLIPTVGGTDHSATAIKLVLNFITGSHCSPHRLCPHYRLLAAALAGGP